MQNRNIILPLVNPFSEPYIIWNKREATQKEKEDYFSQHGRYLTEVKDTIKEKINTPLNAAKYIARVCHDVGLDNFINKALSKSDKYKQMRNSMPSKTPQEISIYQKSYPSYNIDNVNDAINNINSLLSNGQILFHGGSWFNDNLDEITTIRPFSTSFSPQVALRNAEHKGKAYDSNRIDLFVLNIKNSKTKVFVFRNKGTNLGHENEVLFSSGAILKVKSRTLIRDDYIAYKVATGLNMLNKKIPIYILEVDII